MAMVAAKVPRAELERAAREQYAQQFGAAAPAKVRNAQALVALGEHRPLRWRSHRYVVPPVPFRDGARLLVSQQVLKQASEGDAAGERALSVARTVLHGLVRRRRLGRTYRPLRNPFRDATAAEAVALIDWLLDVPDETPTTSGAPAKTIDLMAGFMEAGREFPFCFDPATGLPHSWAHYQLALRWAGRMHARDELREARAARHGMNAPKDAWKSYSSEMASLGALN